MEKYNHKKIEAKWQKKWDKEKLYKTSDNKDKPKYYILDMFPYPSGAGLHVGHPKGYIATDIFARAKMMQGYNVLHPMGWDAFGLPAENYAIQNKIHPRVATEKNIKIFKKQLLKLGFTYDWDREINTTDPGYYKWTQWTFLKMFERGLAYESNEPVNWCPSCKTVLSNEDLEDGKCERCGSAVERKPMRQWVLKITDYADRLLNDLEKLPAWEEPIKEMQRNWIGRSEGAVLSFKLKVEGLKKKILVGTRNEAKFKMLKACLGNVPGLELISLNDMPKIDDSDLVEGDDWNENAKRKSEYYFKKTGMPTISTDHVLWIKKWPENNGVITHLRKIANPKTGRATDEEAIDFLIKFLRQNGGSSPAHFIYAISYTDENGTISREEFPFEYIMQTERAKSYWPGYPTEALLKDPKTGQYKTEQTDEIRYARVVESLKKYFVPRFSVSQNIKVFTTRIDTIFSGTFLVLSPEHPIIEKLSDYIENIKEVKKFINLVKNKSEIERLDKNNKNGIRLEGIKAINPATDEEIQVWASDFVLGDYGTGAVFADAHDQRDFDMAKKYKIPLKVSVAPNKESIKKISKLEECYEGEGILFNSSQFDSLTSAEARPKIISWLKEKKLAEVKVNYKLRDWVFSRQRYWGEPIPIIHCEKPARPDGRSGGCGNVAVPEKELPLKLPEVKNYEPTGTGESPLANIKEWVNTKCPKCGGRAKRETNTMPQWAGSSWYYLRYIDPKNKKALVDKIKEKYWSPVDFYVGGAEHATRHLIYARFWHKFLFDIGAVNYDEPFPRLPTVGLILSLDGRRMSKRWNNVINPDEIVEKYGADAMRIYEMFMGPFNQSCTWSTKSLIGSRRFLEKIRTFYYKVKLFDCKGVGCDKAPAGLPQLMHKTIKKVTEDIENFHYNTAISQMMIFMNFASQFDSVPRGALENFLKILAPFAPHLTEELWSELDHKLSIFKEEWPKYNSDLIKDEKVNLIVQINGKVRDTVEVLADISEKEAEKTALEREKIKKWLENKEVKKVIFVKGRLVNIVI